MTTEGQRHDRSALILYGSETGNAADYADELGRTSERLRFHTTVASLDDVQPLFLASFSFVVVIISTTGQGDLPNNARNFWREMLRKKLPLSHLQNVNCTTFGLGDSSYPKYKSSSHSPKGGERAPIPDDILLQPKWLLSITSEGQKVMDYRACFNDSSETLASSYLGKGADMTHFQSKLASKTPKYGGIQRLEVILEENLRLTPNSHWQEVRHIRFSSPSLVHYAPGDVLTIHPKNSLEDVQSILKMMDWERVADQQIYLAATSGTEHDILLARNSIPFQNDPCLTLRKLLTGYLDLMAIPRRSFFSLIAHFTDNQMHRERLLEFTDTKYLEELYDYTTRPRRSILEVLQEFDSVKIPWQWAAAVFPKLRGRQFSIASGGELKHHEVTGSRFDLLVAIVRYKTVIKRTREGVCTRYLAGLPAGTHLQVSFQKGSLDIAESEAKRPIIMIGPGTGIAPMRSLIWERYQWQEGIKVQASTLPEPKKEGCHKIGETVLFFGCRSQDADYFYRNEWETLQTKMPLQIYTAFSRDQPQKIYVQDVIREQSALVYRLLYQSRGTIYVCGSSGKMPQAVRAALIDSFKDAGKMQAEAAERYLQLLEREGRYKQETW
ncbi:MAG: hypothetical protein Q9190_006952 [Brigantiaea leucoxantha]